MADKGIGVGNCHKHGEYFLDAEDSPCPSCEDGLKPIYKLNKETLLLQVLDIEKKLKNIRKSIENEDSPKEIMLDVLEMLSDAHGMRSNLNDWESIEGIDNE